MTGAAVRGSAVRNDSSERTTRSATPERRLRRRRANLPTSYRLVFAGPVGAGKTTAVRALSDVPPVDNHVPISAASAEYGDGVKTTTTVGLDYGVWNPTPEISVALFGVPGQDRFAPVRRKSSSADTRILLWLRADRGSIADDAAAWLPRFAGDRERLVIAVSHCPDRALDAVRRTLATVLETHRIPVTRVIAADARERESVVRAACAALDLPEERS